VSKHKGPQTKVIELGDKAMLPGFVDAHGHVVMGGLQAIGANLLPAPDGKVTDIASLQQTLRDWMQANEKAVSEVQLILGFGYDNSQIAEQRAPNRADLDAVSKDIPILTIHQSGHIIACNSKALEIGGISADTPNPVGGVIQREADGKTPNGVLEETAGFPVLAKLLSRIGAERAPSIALSGSRLWARYGYTTAQEGRGTPATWKILQRLGETGELKIDVAMYADVLVDRELVKSMYSPTYTNRTRIAGAKLTIDGSPQGFTAYRDRPYFDPVGNYKPGYLGYAAADAEKVNEAIAWAYANKIQILTHANGEAAIDGLLVATKLAQSQHPQGARRPVLIHGQFLREDQVDGLRTLDILPSLFPMHTFYWGDWHRDHTVGPALADNISPTGWCVQRGMIFTSHHDAPVAFPDSMRVLDATVTRRSRSGDILGPHQRVDVITALKAMTIWPAYQHFEEASKGSLKVGKLADLVILSKDPTAVDPETLDTLQVLETIKEGESIFVLDAAERRKAELMSRPSPAGENAFENFLIATAVQRDFANLPEEVRLRPMMQRALQEARTATPHDKACVLRAMDDLMQAMATGEGAEAGVTAGADAGR
jgi:predicted amidohydrolase YtcJ